MEISVNGQTLPIILRRYRVSVNIYIYIYIIDGMDVSRNVAPLSASPILVMLIPCQGWGFIGGSCTVEEPLHVMYLTRNVALNNLPGTNSHKAISAHNTQDSKKYPDCLYRIHVEVKIRMKFKRLQRLLPLTQIDTISLKKYHLYQFCLG